MSDEKQTKLTNRQHQVLLFIKNYRKNNGESPTLREIGEELDKANKTIVQHLDALENKGFIWRKPNESRNIRLIKTGNTPSVITLPVMASVGCDNMTVEAQNKYEFDEHIQIDRSFLDGRNEDNIVILKAAGDSMKDAGIDNGDLVLVEKTDQVNDGDLVVAIIDGTAVLKRIDFREDAVVLQPESLTDEYEPIVMQKDFEVFGKYIDILRTSQSRTHKKEIQETPPASYADDPGSSDIEF